MPPRASWEKLIALPRKPVTTESPVAPVPPPLTPVVERKELARFFRDVSWTGTIVKNEIGPGTPEITASGPGDARADPRRALDRGERTKAVS